jgi:hypothetical protein
MIRFDSTDAHGVTVRESVAVCQARVHLAARALVRLSDELAAAAEQVDELNVRRASVKSLSALSWLSLCL